MSQFGGPKIVTDGLVLYFDAANPESYVSGSTLWYDISKNRVNGTLVNNPTYSENNGGFLIFNGSTQMITTPTLSSEFLNSGLTLSIILKYNPSTSNDNVICWGLSAFNGTSYSWEFRLRGSSGAAEFSPGIGDGGSGVPQRLSYASPSTWSNRIICFDITYVANGMSTMYENGVSRATRNYNTVGYSSQKNSLLIGKGTDTYFPGNIYLVKLYDRALSSDEVSRNYNAVKSRFGLL